MKRTITLTVNGEQRSVFAEETALLLDVLRGELHLTGAKKGCGKGECGACTVIMNDAAVNSCMIPLGKAEGKRIETVEGLARSGELSILQEEFLTQGAVQCGFCTPGMLMSAAALLRRMPRPNEAAVREAIGGNVCRCTGYAKIVKAILRAAERMEDEKAVCPDI